MNSLTIASCEFPWGDLRVPSLGRIQACFKETLILFGKVVYISLALDEVFTMMANSALLSQDLNLKGH